MKPRTVSCPRCGATVAWIAAELWRPFCSERCKLIDFGGWASEVYRVPTAEAPEVDLATAPQEDDRPRGD